MSDISLNGLLFSSPVGFTTEKQKILRLSIGVNNKITASNGRK